MTPLDWITAGRISFNAQWAARAAICRHVRTIGVGKREIGPRFRRGSNSWRPNDLECLFNRDIVRSPCPNCGAPGDDMLGCEVQYCPACAQEVRIGDYDWLCLGDVERYVTESRAGLVEDDRDIRCGQCSRPFVEIDPNGLLQVDCDRPDCHLRERPCLDAAAPFPPRPRANVSGRPRVLNFNPSARPGFLIASALDRLAGALAGAAERTGAGEDETPYDAARRNFDSATADARQRDLARSA